MLRARDGECNVVSSSVLCSVSSGAAGAKTQVRHHSSTGMRVCVSVCLSNVYLCSVLFLHPKRGTTYLNIPLSWGHYTELVNNCLYSTAEPSESAFVIHTYRVLTTVHIIRRSQFVLETTKCCLPSYLEQSSG